jgi:hypothetical protein
MFHESEGPLRKRRGCLRKSCLLVNQETVVDGLKNPIGSCAPFACVLFDSGDCDQALSPNGKPGRRGNPSLQYVEGSAR